MAENKQILKSAFAVPPRTFVSRIIEGPSREERLAVLEFILSNINKLTASPKSISLLSRVRGRARKLCSSESVGGTETDGRRSQRIS